MLPFLEKLNGSGVNNMNSWLSIAFFTFCSRSFSTAFVFAFCNFMVQTFINLSLLYKCRVRVGGVSR